MLIKAAPDLKNEDTIFPGNAGAQSRRADPAATGSEIGAKLRARAGPGQGRRRAGPRLTLEQRATRRRIIHEAQRDAPGGRAARRRKRA